MISVVMLETTRAERLMKALCNHFARKVFARYEGNEGYIDFGDGECGIRVTPGMMQFQAQAETAEGLEHVKRAVSKHLGHFTPGEEIQLTWK
jgi:hypothetical protein